MQVGIPVVIFPLIPGDKEPVFANSLRFGVKSFPDSPIELNGDFMLDEALAQARINLANYVQEKAKGLGEIDKSELIKPEGPVKVSDLPKSTNSSALLTLDGRQARNSATREAR